MSGGSSAVTSDALADPRAECARPTPASATGVKAELIDDLARVTLDGLDGAHQPVLFDRIEWFRRTWTYCPPGRSPLVVHAHDGEAAVWLFLALRERGQAVALSSWYTLAYRPIFAGQPDLAMQIALLAGCARALRGRLWHVALDRLPPSAAAPLVDAFRASGWAAERQQDCANWTVAVRGLSFADYWAARPGQLRSTVKRKAAKAALQITVHDRFDDVLWAEYADVYNQSWKPEEGSLDFLRATAMAKSSEGRLRLGIARQEGRAVAAQLWTVENDVAIIHKLAHRICCDAFSPGTLLTHAMFRHAIDVDRVALIDFGTGDDRYKADWMTTRTMLDRVELHNLRHPRGLLGAGKRLAARLLGR